MRKAKPLLLVLSAIIFFSQVAVAQKSPNWIRGGGYYGSCIAFSPDGKLIATGGIDNILIKVWDAATGQFIRPFVGHERLVSSIAFSNDGKFLLSGSLDSTLRIWNIATGEEVKRFKMPNFVRTVRYSPDGKRIAVGMSGAATGTLKIINAETGGVEHSIPGDIKEIRSFVLTPDGNQIITVGTMDFSATLWDIATGAVIRKFTGSPDYLLSVAISPDGATLAAAGNDLIVRIWDVASGSLRHQMAGHQKEVRSLSFSRDGRLLASSGLYEAEFKIWDVERGALDRSISVFKRGNSGVVDKVEFSPDSVDPSLATVGNSTFLWNPKTGEELREITGHSNLITSIAFSPDGEQILSASTDGHLRQWSALNGMLENNLFTGAEVNSSLYTPDGAAILAGGGGQSPVIRLLQASTGDSLHAFSGHSLDVRSLALSSDGKKLVSGGADRKVIVWDVATASEEHRLEGHTAEIFAVATSGDIVASGSGYQSIRLWNLRSGALIRELKGHEGAVMSVALSIDGKHLLSGGDDGAVMLWDVATGDSIGRIPPSGASITHVAFLANGSIAVAARSDGRIDFWDTGTLKLLSSYALDFYPSTDMHAAITSFAVSPDQKRLVAGAYDGSVIMWTIDANVLSAPADYTANGNTSSLQVVPNWIQQQAVIKVTMQKASPINLRVIDMRGAVVQHLLQDDAEAGEYSLPFSKTDLPCGQYFIELRTDKESQCVPVMIGR